MEGPRRSLQTVSTASFEEPKLVALGDVAPGPGAVPVGSQAWADFIIEKEGASLWLGGQGGRGCVLCHGSLGSKIVIMPSDAARRYKHIKRIGLARAAGLNPLTHSAVSQFHKGCTRPSPDLDNEPVTPDHLRARKMFMTKSEDVGRFSTIPQRLLLMAPRGPGDPVVEYTLLDPGQRPLFCGRGVVDDDGCIRTKGAQLSKEWTSVLVEQGKSDDRGGIRGSIKLVKEDEHGVRKTLSFPVDYVVAPKRRPPQQLKRKAAPAEGAAVDIVVADVAAAATAASDTATAHHAAAEAVSAAGVVGGVGQRAHVWGATAPTSSTLANQQAEA